MTNYASGRYVYNCCQRCGLPFPYMHLREDGDTKGLRVCAECYEDEHPQDMGPRRIDDPVAIRDPAVCANCDPKDYIIEYPSYDPTTASYFGPNWLQAEYGQLSFEFQRTIPVIAFSSATYSANYSADIPVTIQRTESTFGESTVDLAVSGLVAISGTDFNLSSQSITFPDGVSSIVRTIDTLTPTYDSEVLAGAPYAFWKINETSGTNIVDYSGNNRPLTVNSGAIDRSRAAVRALGGVTSRFLTGDRAGRGITAALLGNTNICCDGWFRGNGTLAAPRVLLSIGGVTSDTNDTTNWQFRATIETNGTPSIFWEFNSGSDINIGFPEYRDIVAALLTSQTPYYFMYGRHAARSVVYCRINDGPVVEKPYTTPPTGGSAALLTIGNQQSLEFPANGDLGDVALYLSAIQPDRYARWRIGAQRTIALSLSNPTEANLGVITSSQATIQL